MKSILNLVFISIILTSILLPKNAVVHCDVFTAIYKIKEISSIENNLLTSLQTYINEREKAEKPVQNEIKSFLNKTRSDNQYLVSHETYPEHPINAYRMIRRIHNSWKDLMEEVNCPNCESDNNTEIFVSEFEKVRKILWPTEKDIKGAALAIFRLIHVYRLNTTEVLLGNINGYRSSPISVKEALQLSSFASDDNLVYEEIVWLKALYQLFKSDQIDKGQYNLEHIDRAIAGAYSRYGMPWESLKYIQECIQNKPDQKSCVRDKDFYEMKLNQIPMNSRHKKLEAEPKSEVLKKYEALCRGDKILSDASVARQKCFFRSMSGPYERVKEEVFSFNPRIALYYDIITESEIQHIQQESRKKLNRSRVILGDHDQMNNEWRYRVSQSAWIWDSDNVIRKMTKRIEKITGLDTQLKIQASSAEPFQVLNYGIGGMYEPHVDYIENTDDARQVFDMLKQSGERMANWRTFGDVELPDDLKHDYLIGAGDRLATWLIYLTDVPLGGATVFPKVNIRVPVVKGAAAFWYKFNKKHYRDPRTEHAGCPVVIGSKWVSNKWFRENGQTFRRLCGLTKKELDR